MSRNVVIVSAARTPVRSFMRAISNIKAQALGATAIKGNIKK